MCCQENTAQCHFSSGCLFLESSFQAPTVHWVVWCDLLDSVFSYAYTKSHYYMVTVKDSQNLALPTQAMLWFCGIHYPFPPHIDTCFAAQVSLEAAWAKGKCILWERASILRYWWCCKHLTPVSQYWVCHCDFNKQWLRSAVEEWDLSAQVKNINQLAWTLHS